MDVPKISDEATKALTTPLAIEGTVDELDAELSQQLVKYAAAHRPLQDGVAAATQKITAALAVIEEREQNKSKAKAVPPAKKAWFGAVPTWTTCPVQFSQSLSEILSTIRGTLGFQTNRALRDCVSRQWFARSLPLLWQQWRT
jgi:PRTRC genetic system protein E